MPSYPDEFYHSLPKVELHRHLEGSLRLSTLQEIANEYDSAFPGGENLRPLVQVLQSDPHTSENFLSKFEVLRDFYLSPEIIMRITEEAIADAAADNVRYLELRFTPAALSKAAGFQLGEVLDWVIEGVKKAQIKYQVATGLLVSVNRHESLELAERIAIEAVDRINSGVVGLDLAGDEAHFPAAPFEPVFREARQDGLKTTIHAGEWGSARNIVEAIELFQADRIGHGVRVMEDPNAVAAAREFGTSFEVCPTSNYQSGVVADLAQHPVQQMIESGLNVTINTDDPGISQITLSDEYAQVCERIGMSLETLQGRIIAAARAAFLPAEERETLAASLEQQLDKTAIPD
jgi:adenosine deaminase